MKIGLQAIASALVGLVVLGVLLFWPAGTVDYWQGWVFLAIFVVATTVPSIYLSVKDPAALARRMHGGPAAEPRLTQKIVITVLFAALGGALIVSAFDRRFGWSTVPPLISLVGDALVLIGLGIAMLVVIQNSYAAATITVEADQQLVSSGLYRFVRHPMYIGTLIMMLGIPLALGSYWGLLLVAPAVLVLPVRILDEEKMLRHDLSGYAEYCHQVRYRLLPHVW